jgi:hypothetical protein
MHGMTCQRNPPVTSEARSSGRNNQDRLILSDPLEVSYLQSKSLIARTVPDDIWHLSARDELRPRRLSSRFIPEISPKIRHRAESQSSVNATSNVQITRRISQDSYSTAIVSAMRLTASKAKIGSVLSPNNV